MMRSHIVNFSSFLILIVNLICLLSTLHTQTARGCLGHYLSYTNQCIPPLKLRMRNYGC
jgi:hypothetical protein